MTRLAGVVWLLMISTGVARGAEPMESKRSAQDSPADLRPDSGFWRGVPAVFAERDTSGKVLAGYRTEVRSRWTERNLYFLFVCPYTQLTLTSDPKTKTETNQLWKWDVAEAFIGSDFKNIRRYKEFEISPQGEWVDLDIDLDAPRHENGWTWNSGFQAAARIDGEKKIWYGFMGIPYAAVDGRPAKVGNVLRINLFRSQGVQPRLINWQPTGRPSFHVPEAFGEMKLVQ